jgi:hypothetical protein
MITTQQRIPGITTECPPAITAVGDKYILAWTNNDATMSWTTLSVNSSQDGYDRGDIKATGFSTTAGYGPALTNLGGAVWMAWLENPEQAPFIPPSVQRRQPPVIMVSSLSGSTWSRAQPLWNPGLTGSDLYQDSYQGPTAVSSPALAATESELFAVWIENAVNGSDALALFYEGTLASPPAQPTIFFAKWRSGSGWTQRQAVPNALSASAPALAAFNGVVSMAFKGHEDAQIWFAQYTNDKGWTARAKLPGFDTATGPGLAVGDTGNVHMVWVKHSSNNLVAATLGEDGKWSSEAPGTGWSTPLPLPVIETGLPPALGSQSSASDTVTLAITGASNKDIVVMPMTAFAVVANPKAVQRCVPV